jgi:type IV pilus assembly protein PilE
MRRPTPGFTLVELACVLVALALLAALALPSFVDSLRRARRSEATAALQQLQLAEERWRTDHASYTPALPDLGLPALTGSGYYAIAINAADDQGFTADANAAATQLADTSCRVIELVQAGGRVGYASIDASGRLSTASPDPCWAS